MAQQGAGAGYIGELFHNQYKSPQRKKPYTYMICVCERHVIRCGEEIMFLKQAFIVYMCKYSHLFPHPVFNNVSQTSLFWTPLQQLLCLFCVCPLEKGHLLWRPELHVLFVSLCFQQWAGSLTWKEQHYTIHSIFRHNFIGTLHSTHAQLGRHTRASHLGHNSIAFSFQHCM